MVLCRRVMRSLLRTTALLGSSQVINLALGAALTKLIALLSGQLGIGVWGLLNSLVRVLVAGLGFGTQTSATRLLGSLDDEESRRTALRVVRGLSRKLALASLVAALCLGPVLSAWEWIPPHLGRVSTMTFVGLAVAFEIVARSELGILQGLRAIRELAGARIVGAIVGLALGASCLWFFEQRGVPGMLTTSAFGMWLGALYFSKKWRSADASSTSNAPEGVLRLGSAVAFSALLHEGIGYVVRVQLEAKHGLEAVGVYQAVWMIGSLYIAIVLDALAGDFLPRLSSLISNSKDVRPLVNERTTIAVLLVTMGVIWVIVLSPLLLRLLFSTSFEPGASALRIQAIAMSLRSIAWPLDYILLARQDRRRLVLLQCLFAVLFLGFVWLLLPRWGIAGIAAAYLLAFSVYLLATFDIARRSVKFSWTKETKRAIAVGVGVVVAGFLIAERLPLLAGILFAAAATPALFALVLDFQRRTRAE